MPAKSLAYWSWFSAVVVVAIVIVGWAFGGFVFGFGPSFVDDRGFALNADTLVGMWLPRVEVGGNTFYLYEGYESRPDEHNVCAGSLRYTDQESAAAILAGWRYIEFQESENTRVKRWVLAVLPLQRGEEVYKYCQRWAQSSWDFPVFRGVIVRLGNYKALIGWRVWFFQPDEVVVFPWQEE